MDEKGKVMGSGSGNKKRDKKKADKEKEVAETKEDVIDEIKSLYKLLKVPKK